MNNEEENKNARLPARLLKAITACTATSKGYYVLNGMYIDGQHIVTSDRDVLADVTLPQPITIPSVPAVWTCPDKVPSAKTTEATIERTDSDEELSVVIHKGKGITEHLPPLTKMEGRFPNYKEVIPKQEDSIAHAMFQIDNLQRCLDVIAATPQKNDDDWGPRLVRIDLYVGEKSPATLTIPEYVRDADGFNAIAVISPVVQEGLEGEKNDA